MDEKPPLSIIARLEDGHELQDDDFLSNQDGEKYIGMASEDLILKTFLDFVGEYES